MIPRNDTPNPQRELFKHYLEDMINLKHPLAQLADRIDWEAVQTFCAPRYCSDNPKFDS